MIKNVVTQSSNVIRLLQVTKIYVLCILVNDFVIWRGQYDGMGFRVIKIISDKI